MKISDTLDVDYPIQQVWELLQDPRHFLAAMPGVESCEMVDEVTFDTVVAQRVGPFRARFQIRMNLIEVDPPHRLVATGQGKEASGSMLRIPSAVIELEPLSEGRTRVSFEIEFSLMGKLGSLGYPVIKRKAGEMSKQFAENLKDASKGPAS